MKKLMILVAVAATAGVAAASACVPGGSTSCVSGTVYAARFALKTTVAAQCNVAAASGTDCAPGGTASIVRKPGTYVLQGWFANCLCMCDPTQFTKNHIALWSTKDKLFLKDITYATTAKFAHVLSTTKADAEIYFNLKGTTDNAAGNSGISRTWDLLCAGFGKFNKATGKFTSFSGNVVGTATAPWYVSYNASTHAYECKQGKYWLCEDITAQCPTVDADPSIAYGTFTLSYNDAASKKIAKQTALPAIPAYVTTPTGW